MSFSYLWNDLPKEERRRLMPHAIESQLVHIQQCKIRAIKHHKNHMREINALQNELKKELGKYELKRLTKDKQ